MRMYNIKVEKVEHKCIIGYGEIFNGEMFRIYKNGKRIFTLEFPFNPSKNYLKRCITKNLYRPALPF